MRFIIKIMYSSYKLKCTQYFKLQFFSATHNYANDSFIQNYVIKYSIFESKTNFTMQKP